MSRRQWEYAAMAWTPGGIDSMNEMGSEGWEAFAVDRGTVLYRRIVNPYVTFVFDRPSRENE